MNKRPIPGWPRYVAAENGSIRNLRGDALAPHPNYHGYLLVSLYDDSGKRSRVYVHKLIAEAFHGPRPEGMQIRHLDGDRLNNAPANLAYGTAAENAADAVSHGTHRWARVTHCPAGHAYDEANTYVWRGTRACRTCKRLRWHERKAA